ncbi:MAG: hypothetical protein HC851_18360 [Acaryochloris sp. RU_4_1]|nr:hypothetical protein [Acaryochloris sp. RU_4_1]NJR56676.1 hypothetical protein [Acaryochloris sp. CRU_2_0]
MKTHPTLPKIPNLPTVNAVFSTVSVVTVATAQELMASGDLTLNGAQRLFNPAVWPQLEPEVTRVPFNRKKAECFRDCVAYLMQEATTLRSERRPFDALKHIDVALTLEALIYDGHADE